MTASSKPPFAGEARRVRLGELISKAKVERCGDRDFPVLSMTMHDGIVRQADRFKKAIASKDVSLYKVVRPNQLVVGFPIDEGVIYVQGYDCPGIMSPAYNVWDIDSDKVAPAYLELALHSPRSMAYYAERMRGTTARRRSITSENLTAMQVSLPSLAEQLNVIATLGSVKKLASVCSRQLSLLDELVKSRFVEIFGDPVENPMGFRRETLAALGDLKNGVNYRKGETGCTVLCLGVSDFGNRSELRGVSGLSPVSFSSRPSEESFLKDGDIVFVRSNGNRKLVGRCMAVYPQGDDVIYSGFCIRFRLTSDNVRIPYLVWSLKQPSMRELLLGRGANVQNLNQRALSDVLVPIPSLRMQDAFAAFAAEVAKSRFVGRMARDCLNCYVRAMRLTAERGRCPCFSSNRLK